MIYRMVEDPKFDCMPNLLIAIEVKRNGKKLRNGVRIGVKTIPKYIKARQMLKDWAIKKLEKKGSKNG